MVDLKQALKYIDPSALDYEEWLEIGMGLKSAADNGEPVTWQDWDSWSVADSRYEKGVCSTKWRSFGSGGKDRINKGTIIFRAMLNGFNPFESTREFDWDDEISIDKKPITESDFVKYIQTIFEPNDLVSFVTQTNKNDHGKYYPANSGTYGIEAQKLVDDFNKHENIEDAIGSYNHNAGVWIRVKALVILMLLSLNIP